jgi:hypothetical protein
MPLVDMSWSPTNYRFDTNIYKKYYQHLYIELASSRTHAPAVLFLYRSARPCKAHATLNVTRIEKRGKGHLMPIRRREEDETPRRGGRCNTRSAFEIFRRNTCNIRLKSDGTLETCIWDTRKNTWKTHKQLQKQTQHPDKTLTIYV